MHPHSETVQMESLHGVISLHVYALRGRLRDSCPDKWRACLQHKLMGTNTFLHVNMDTDARERRHYQTLSPLIYIYIILLSHISQVMCTLLESAS